VATPWLGDPSQGVVPEDVRSDPEDLCQG
jgi:hypothetical protein